MLLQISLMLHLLLKGRAAATAVTAVTAAATMLAREQQVEGASFKYHKRKPPKVSANSILLS